ncbi:MAG: PilC/PilY family type IV pilus protein [Desulfuromonas sp.]
MPGKLKLQAWCGAIIMVMFLAGYSCAEVDISDVPLDAQTKAAPANIMFVLDDSGSMDWEVMTTEVDGIFDGRYYIFDNPGDNLPYSNSHFTSAQRLMWKSQWFGYNSMYYNPATTYEPWPTLPDADPDKPRSHPNIAANYLTLSDSFAQLFVTGADANVIIVDNKDADFTEVSGSWYESSATNEFRDSSKYSSSSGARAKWEFYIPEKDDYQVLAWWTKTSTTRDSAAQYVVHHADGETTYTVNQNYNFGSWQPLGTHEFNVGSTLIEVKRGNTTTVADAVMLIPGGGAGYVDIPNAHYYVESESEGRPYLVIVDADAITYYAVTAVTGSEGTESVEGLELISNPPSDVKTTRSYAEERQNFANWYSFYRRRQLTATAAISKVISKMSGVQVGIHSINANINQPVLKIKVGGVDETETLLSSLYSFNLKQQGTPLRIGLRSVGRYYHQDDGYTGGIGACPYWAAEDGGECQQAFTILMTDGYWNGNSPYVGNADGSAGAPYADTYSNTLADVAYYYWGTDLSSGLDDLVPTTEVDKADWQHMVTYSVSFGVTGTLDPEEYKCTLYPDTCDEEETKTITWPSPFSGIEEHKIDDLFHAAVNGRGKFLSAGNPEELVNSLLEILLDIEARVGSASSVSVNGDQIYKKIDNNTFLFQASYDTVGWLGNVKSFKIDPLTGNIDLFNPEWSASSEWEKEDWATFWTNRVIATYNEDSSAGVPFRIDSLTDSQIALLGADAADILNYIRGNDSNEEKKGGTFRNRTSRLGDIVHSSPVYHEGVLYAGANDGMLHAIIAEGADAGKELFSYVPSQVIKNLPELANPAYLHKYYVDLTATIQRITLGGTPTTVLIGGLGQGGLGYFALDLTGRTTYNTTTKLWEPAAVDEATIASNVLWEFPNSSTSASDVSDIGYSFSESLVVRTNDPNHPWVVIFGNGYNSADGQSVLFILNPADGSVLKKFELGSGPDNGLSTPAVIDVNADNKADYIYAGDLHGNLWKIDLSASDLDNWKVSFNDGTADLPLFKAVGSSGPQPITAKPDVMFHSTMHGYMVVFGTGKFLGLSDSVDNSPQTVYGLWDYGDDSDRTENLGTFDPVTGQVSNLSSFSTLLEQTVLLDDLLFDPDNDGIGEILRITSNNSITWVTESDADSAEKPNPSTSVKNNVGWFFDLPKSGERVVSRTMIRDGRAIFISYIPMLSPCSTGGDSILHELNAADGSRFDKPVFDISSDGRIDGSDYVSIDDPDNPGETINVAPSGIQRKGQLQPPAILRDKNNEEVKYSSSTSGSIEMIRERSARIGSTFWREF